MAQAKTSFSGLATLPSQTVEERNNCLRRVWEVCLWTSQAQSKPQNKHVDSGNGWLSDEGSIPSVSTIYKKGAA